MSISADKLRRMFEEGFGKRLLSIKNVVGYSTTPKKKITKGIETDIDCIRIYVKRKVPKIELRAEDIIPESIEGMPTDVVEIGELRALAYTQRMRPCPPGFSIGEKSITAGTFGCVVKDNQSGENWILSNNHVLAAENKAPIGSEILQPGTYDGGTVANDTIAKLARFVAVNIGGASGCTLSRAVVGILNGLSIAFGRKTRFRAVVEQLSNDVDCAAARPIDQADILLEVKDIGKPSGTAEAQVGAECHKTGRTTMHTHLKVTDVNFTGNVQYSSGVALFVDQIVAQGIGGAGSSGGDSGSAVFLASGDGTTLTGLLFAGSDTQNITIINKIQNVFRELGVSLAT